MFRRQSVPTLQPPAMQRRASVPTLQPAEHFIFHLDAAMAPPEAGPPPDEIIGPPRVGIAAQIPTLHHAIADPGLLVPERAVPMVLPEATPGLFRSASWPFLPDLPVWTPSEEDVEMGVGMDVTESPKPFEGW